MTTRSVCFTIFEPSWAHEVLYDPAIKCAVVQQEKCPETGKLHFQGYMQLASPMRFAGIKKLLHCDSAHLETAKGTPQQAWDYCCKEDSRIDGPWTYGDRPKGQGNRYVTVSRHEVAGNTSRHFGNAWGGGLHDAQGAEYHGAAYNRDDEGHNDRYRYPNGNHPGSDDAGNSSGAYS